MRWGDRFRSIAETFRLVPSKATAGLSDEQVVETFQALLGEAPAAGDLAQIRSVVPHRIALVDQVMRSPEFTDQFAHIVPELVAGWIDDLLVFRQFGRYSGPGTKGYVTDFLGTRTDVRFIKGIEGLDGAVERYPVPRGNFHGDTTEWVATLLSVLAAKDRIVVVELGAGWAPWLVASARAAAVRGIRQSRLIGVEGSSGHVAMMFQHFDCNSIPTAGNLLLHGIVGKQDGEGGFPVAADPAADWGQAAIFETSARPESDYRGQRIDRLEKVPMYSLDSLLANEASVDLLHIDVQGSEVEIIESGLETLRRKVKCIVIGTHGRSIESRLFEVLTADGWSLCRDHSCRVAQAAVGQISCIVDGCQMWRNPRLIQ